MHSFFHGVKASTLGSAKRVVSDFVSMDSGGSVGALVGVAVPSILLAVSCPVYFAVRGVAAHMNQAFKDARESVEAEALAKSEAAPPAAPA